MLLLTHHTLEMYVDKKRKLGERNLHLSFKKNLKFITVSYSFESMQVAFKKSEHFMKKNLIC